MAYIRVGILVLLILSIGANYLAVQKISTLSDEREQLVQAANDSGRIAHTYINLHGLEVSKNKVLVLDLKNARDLKNDPSLSFVKEFAGVRANLKNLESTLRAEIEAKITTQSVLGHDTTVNGIHVRLAKISDKWNSFITTLKGDTVKLEGKITAPIKGVMYWERKHKVWFVHFGRKIWTSELYSDNPMVKITEQEYIKIVKRGR